MPVYGTKDDCLAFIKNVYVTTNHPTEKQTEDTNKYLTEIGEVNKHGKR